MSETVTNEWRIFGPPGTGKTTNMARQVTNAVMKHGPEKVMVASFTRAAAREIASRGIPIADNRVGTLHSHCFRALDGQYGVAESKITLWNETFPQWRLSGGKVTDMDGPGQKGFPGDEPMQFIQKYRGQMIKKELWSPSLQFFNEQWGSWKAEFGLVDFTDMLEISLDNIEYIPGNPTVGFFDEVQDFTPLELALVRKWGKHMDHIVLAGDDDQCIYAFKGATPDSFLKPEIPSENKKILPLSYRLPRTVHKFSSEWIHRVSMREKKEFKPADREGEIVRINSGFKGPETMIHCVRQDVAAGMTVMILASCGYMLRETIELLKFQGMPFHNPFQLERGDWNPLHKGSDKSIPTWQRVYNFMKPRDDLFYLGSQVKDFFHLINSKTALQYGAKKAMEAIGDDRLLSVKDISGFMRPAPGKEFIDALYSLGQDRIEAMMGFLKKYAKAQKKKPLEYIHRVIIENGGPEILKQPPKVILGTIHSVKGAEADSVYVVPDLSYRGHKEFLNPATFDSVIRVFYVAFTRTRNKLTLLSPSTSFSVM